MKRNDSAARKLKRNTIGGVMGNVLEWYDFGVYGYFAAVIGAQFFPAEDHLASTIAAFGVFAAGYLMRPIGGIVYGHIGDRLGRKKALQLSMAMMSIPTVLLGLLPTHDQVGLTASILLVVLRLVQGFSVGGELIGSISFVSETAPLGRRGFYASFTTFSAICGILLGSSVATIIHGLLDADQVSAWGWRLPFLSGFFLGAFGLWMRRGITETPDFEKLKKDSGLVEIPIKEALGTNRRQVLHVFCLIAGMAGAFYQLFVWWPTYLGTIVTPRIPHALAVNTAATLVLVALIPLMGHLSDLVGRKKMMAASYAGLIVFAYPVFVLSDYGILWIACVCQLWLAVVLSLGEGAMPAAIAEIFPTRTRYSGVGMGYNVSVSLFGGTMPLACTWLIAWTGDLRAPAFYLMGLCLLSLLASMALRPIPN